MLYPPRMLRKLLLLALTAIAASAPTQAQWQLQDSHSTASFRGVVNVGKGIVWVSGTQGTVLHTIDDGKTWERCTTPEGAEKLDFRGIQAWDANTSIVMSIGKGNQSRLYKTTDACKTWKLLYTNPDADGFWDNLNFRTPQRGYILGDPVKGRFTLLATFDGGMTWKSVDQPGLAVPEGEHGGAFAASNSLMLNHLPLVFATSNGWLYQGNSTCTMGLAQNNPEACLPLFDFVKQQIPLARGTSAAGIFSIAESPRGTVAVGGDYQKPTAPEGTAAYSTDRGPHWQPAQTPPHGYRSSVAYDTTHKAWITVGPNGTDISYDDGKNWKPLGTDRAESDNWNALSLPFAVGPKGRIGKLKPVAFKH